VAIIDQVTFTRIFVTPTVISSAFAPLILGANSTVLLDLPSLVWAAIADDNSHMEEVYPLDRTARSRPYFYRQHQ
jgi:hypothetical protein